MDGLCEFCGAPDDGAKAIIESMFEATWAHTDCLDAAKVDDVVAVDPARFAR